MKTCTSLLFAVATLMGSVAANSANEKIEGTRILAGGRNAPTIIAAAPVKQEKALAKRSAVKRTEVLAGGRNAPAQVIRQPVREFQVAPAVRKNK